MALPLTLNGITPPVLRGDVYFRDDFLALHAPLGIQSLNKIDFYHAAAISSIPGSTRQDLETPWGYGGPIATYESALVAGLAEWRATQTREGRVAELIRLHPFINPEALHNRLDMLLFNRPTVLVRLDNPPEVRWAFYSDSTRRHLRKAQRLLTIRTLASEEWPVFRNLYEEGLKRNNATSSYYFGEAFYQTLLAKPWCQTWVAEDTEGPLATCCFLHADAPLAHYHLGGGNDRSRRTDALYLLFETAFCHYAEAGCLWLHLGGGRTTASDDMLLHFKSKFSPDRARFYIGGMIFDRYAYDQLGGGRARFLCEGAAPRIEYHPANQVSS